MVQVNAGSADEEEHQRGLAHFLEHALFLGTEKFPTQKDMKQLLRRLGVSMYKVIGANSYRYTVPAFFNNKDHKFPTQKDRKQLLRCLCDCMSVCLSVCIWDCVGACVFICVSVCICV